MEHELVKRTLGFARRRKKWIALLAAFGVSSYAAYRVYHSPCLTRKRKRLVKLLSAMASVLEMASDSADTISIVSKDLKEFLQSDTDEIPRSLRQISKIAQSDEFSQSVSRVSEALTVGIMRGYKTEPRLHNGSKVGLQGVNYADKVMDRLFSTAGTGFASVVVGSFARNLVLGFYSSNESGLKTNNNDTDECSSKSSELPRWLSVACDDKCRELIGDCIQKFVSTAVAVYLDKTMSINTYDEIFSGLTNPNHQTKVQDIIVTVCNNAITTLIRTSHQVLTTPDPAPKSSCSIVDQNEDPGFVRAKPFDHELEAPSFLSTLAVPSNKKFVLDVTGRVTFETVRSLLMFMSWKMSEVVKRSAGTFREEVVLRSLGVARFVGAKSSVIVTMWLALYLHVIGGTGVVLAA